MFILYQLVFVSTSKFICQIAIISDIKEKDAVENEAKADEEKGKVKQTISVSTCEDGPVIGSIDFESNENWEQLEVSVENLHGSAGLFITYHGDVKIQIRDVCF